MRGVLNKIVQQKKQEIAARQQVLPLAQLKADKSIQRVPMSMRQAILSGSGVIAEFKRASPSKGLIRDQANPIRIAQSYVLAGASGISVLTDKTFFQGSEGDLCQVRAVIDQPILRKDFTIEPYQVFEAKSMGADCVLLIASILKKDKLADLHSIASDLGLEALVEIHEERELEKLSGNEKLIGINNRNLDTFEVDIDNSIRLAGQLPEVVKIAESGLSNDLSLKSLVEAGFHGFLVGEAFMRADDPGTACANFIKQIKAS